LVQTIVPPKTNNQDLKKKKKKKDYAFVAKIQSGKLKMG
jgi:hypothetical protein